MILKNSSLYDLLKLQTNGLSSTLAMIKITFLTIMLACGRFTSDLFFQQDVNKDFLWTKLTR